MLTLIVIAVIFAALLSNCLRIAGDTQRFAVCRLGRFTGIRGPGLLLIAPFVDTVERLGVGDVGRVNAEGVVRFGRMEIPVGDSVDAVPGDALRIGGFNGDGPIFEVLDTGGETPRPNGAPVHDTNAAAHEGPRTPTD